MKLDTLTVNVRPLPAYQALDLGFNIARAWFLSLWGLWWRGFLSLPLLLLLGFWVFCLVRYETVYTETLFVMALIWFLKPFFEFDLLVFLSQKLFDEKISAKAIKGRSKLSFKEKVALLPYKFSIQRILRMAVTHLEKQPKSAVKLRLQALSRGSGNALSAQVFIFSVVESMLIVGSWLFLIDLLSFDVLGYNASNWIFEAEALPKWFLVLGFFIYLLALSVLAPFFVASSFALYVCRRSHLEGWDIELAFRGLIARYQAQAHMLDNQPVITKSKESA